MDEPANFQDWELLQTSDMSSVHPPDPSRDFGGIEGDTEGSIKSDYFSLSSDNRYARTAAETDDHSAGEGSDASDNPSWVDPSSEPRYGEESATAKRIDDFWSESGSSSGDLSGSNTGLGVGFGRIGETEEFKAKDASYYEFWIKSGADHEGEAVNGSEMDVVRGESESEGERESCEEMKNGSSGEGVRSGDQEGKRGGGVWWKVPLEVLKFCVFRVSPFWSFSIAAAVVGFVILGRRLHKLRRKSQSIPLKFTVDDKKVSQFMTRAARINEAFSIVRRVPMVRPSLPATGLTPWPVMSLR